jgi:branched-subunit amino acid aminotransferase/4-amino-4-deoxychorismate lyase
MGGGGGTLVVDGAPAAPFASPAAFVAAAPPGAYTTALALDGFLIADWPAHVERLARSLAAVHAARAGAFAAYYSWLEGQPGGEAEALQRLLLSSTLACLRALAGAAGTAHDALLAVALGPGAAGAPLAVRAHAWPYAADDAAADFARRLARSDALRSGAGPAAEPAAAPAPGLAPVVWAAAVGGRRAIAGAKYTEWVAERAPLEALRPAGAADALLAAPDGRLLEGLVTNLFVVAERPAAAGGGVVLQTAGVSEGVVRGVARGRVLAAAASLGLPVDERAPDPSARAAWREAFLTNAARGVQPLARLGCAARNALGLPPWEAALPAAPGPWTARLAAAAAAAPLTDLRDLQ